MPTVTEQISPDDEFWALTLPGAEIEALLEDPHAFVAARTGVILPKGQSLTLAFTYSMPSDSDYCVHGIRGSHLIRIRCPRVEPNSNIPSVPSLANPAVHVKFLTDLKLATFHFSPESTSSSNGTIARIVQNPHCLAETLNDPNHSILEVQSDGSLKEAPHVRFALLPEDQLDRFDFIYQTLENPCPPPTTLHDCFGGAGAYTVDQEGNIVITLDSAAVPKWCG